MSAIDAYLDELGAALRVRGTARRRFLAESAEHLRECADNHGEAEAVARFGPARDVALAFDTEVAASRGDRATRAALAALVLAAVAVVRLAHALGPHAAAPSAFPIVFVVSAQVGAVAAALAAVQALRWRRGGAPAGTLRLLARRNAIALAATGVTLLATTWAIGGAGSGAVLAGGLLASAAALRLVCRAGRLARALPGSELQGAASPLADLGVLCARLPAAAAALVRVRRWVDPVSAPLRCCALVCLIAAWCAFARDQGEGASVGRAAVTGAIEAAAVVVCFLALGRPLGLRPGPAARPSEG